ncbi:MAG TPA: type II toxin-antitoxin system HipA family toxin [Acidimicrobiales bacterium]|nr:type II toxin-antitoxin system HipA family toxin [Acidimicrobiales bacterium]
MTETLLVLLGDSVAGTLTRDGDRLTFRYEEQYQDRDRPTPLSVAMPPTVREHPHGVVDPWLWGLLPENDQVIARWARAYRVAPTAYGLLSSPVGLDCPGGVRFVRPGDLDSALAPEGEVRWLTEEGVGARLADLRADTTAWLGNDFAGRFSLAGAQAKTALLHEGGRWGLPSGPAATSHILKPAITGFDDHDLNEHLCLRAAALVGLPAARSRVITFGDEQAIVIERYDRYRTGSGALRRVHQEDTCQALGVRPAHKYQSDGGPGPRDIASLLRRVMPPRVADDAIWSFADALVFNWVIAGTDAHAKNYSLLLNRDNVRFAPLYDLASALPYGRHETEMRLAMRLGSDYRLNVIPSVWLDLARDIGMPVEMLRDRAERLTLAIPQEFSAAAEEVAGATDSPLPARLVDAVAERARRCVSAFTPETT